MKNCISIIVILSLLMAVAACEPEPEDLFIHHFVIEKGDHYCTPRLIETLQDNHLRFTATFDSTAVYDLHDAALQTNKNKLLGFADCNSQHHENSARFAWQWYNNRLEIYAYCYVDQKRVEQYVGTVRINVINQYEIELTNDAYVFRLNEEAPVRIPRAHTCNSGVYYMLWPYFGGSVPAPQQVKIDVAIRY